MEQPKEEKLFTFKDIEGNQQFEAIEDAGKLLDFLREKDPKIKLISIVGSTVKGYALSKPRMIPGISKISDIDICLIYEDEKADDIGGSNTSYKAEYHYIPMFQEQCKREIHALSEINMLKLTKQEIVHNPALCISGLVYPVIGDRNIFNEYIDKVRRVISDLSQSESESWIENFTSGIMKYEHTHKSMMRRGEDENSRGSVDKFRDSRYKLYRERIKKLFIDEK